MIDHFLLGREFFEVLTAHDEAIAVQVAAEGCRGMQRPAEELAEATGVLNAERCTHERTVATPTGRIVVPRRGPSGRKPR